MSGGPSVVDIPAPVDIGDILPVDMVDVPFNPGPPPEPSGLADALNEVLLLRARLLEVR